MLFRLLREHLRPYRARLLAIALLGVPLLIIVQTVVAAAGTPEALALLAAGAPRPDVLLTDFDLGAGDTGDAAISALRAALGAPVPAVIVTGEHSAAVTAGVTEGLGVGVLRKPVAEVELRGAIAALLRGRG